MMKNTLRRVFAVCVSLLFWGLACTGTVAALDKKEYKVFIVLDTIDIWSTGIRDGIKTSLDKSLATLGAKATYTEFDTKTDPAEVPAIIKAIKDGKPDLICMAVFPDGFADTQIAAKLTDPAYRFVSADPIPLQTGLIKSWAKPGGNITGVGVFLQFNSQIRLAKSINPRYNKLVFYTWDAMEQINNWFETEIKTACKQEGVELYSFKRVKNIEEEFALFREVEKLTTNYFILGGISAFVHADGSPADANNEEPAYIRENIKKTLIMNYDESAIKLGGSVAGAAVIWSDIGAQLGEKGFLILQGANPGDLPWVYPRKYNILFNQKLAKALSITIPQNLLSAAYRVYTDYSGTYTGQP